MTRSMRLTDEQVLAARDMIPAYFHDETNCWYMADRWADGDRGWAWSWSVWDEDAKIWNGIEPEDVPQDLREDVEEY